MGSICYATEAQPADRVSPIVSCANPRPRIPRGLRSTRGKQPVRLSEGRSISGRHRSQHLAHDIAQQLAASGDRARDASARATSASRAAATGDRSASMTKAELLALSALKARGTSPK